MKLDTTKKKKEMEQGVWLIFAEKEVKIRHNEEKYTGQGNCLGLGYGNVFDNEFLQVFLKRLKCSAFTYFSGCCVPV